MPLHHLTGQDSSADRTVVLDTDGVEPPLVTVVEPIWVDPATVDIPLDALSDVETGTPPESVSLALRRDPDGIYRLEPIQSGVATGVAYRHLQFIAATRWQIHHGLAFEPAGVLIREGSAPGTLVEPDDIVFPLPGWVELVFGVPIAGTAWLS